MLLNEDFVKSKNEKVNKTTFMGQPITHLNREELYAVIVSMDELHRAGKTSTLHTKETL